MNDPMFVETLIISSSFFYHRDYFDCFRAAAGKRLTVSQPLYLLFTERHQFRTGDTQIVLGYP